MKKILLIILGIVLVLALAFVALFFYSRAHIMDKGMEYGATYNLLQGKWVELYPSSPENAVRFSIKGDVLTYTAYEGKNKVEKTAKFTLDSTSQISHTNQYFSFLFPGGEERPMDDYLYQIVETDDGLAGVISFLFFEDDGVGYFISGEFVREEDRAFFPESGYRSPLAAELDGNEAVPTIAENESDNG